MVIMIDSAHAVHDNMRDHAGGVTFFGTGVIDQKLSKQKMNTRSSTETEHVGTSEYLPKPIFFELFMNAQGYKPKLTLAKDNESELSMLNNGKASYTKTPCMLNLLEYRPYQKWKHQSKILSYR